MKNLPCIYSFIYGTSNEDLKTQPGYRWGRCIKLIRRRTVSKSVVFDNLANFLSISPNQTKFLPWSQLDFSAIHVSVSAVSLRRLSTYILLGLKIANFVRGDGNIVKRGWACTSQPHQLSVFGEKFPTAEFCKNIISAETPCLEIERKQPNF